MIRINFNKDNFKHWLKMPIETSKGVVYDEDDLDIISDYNRKPITHQDFVNSVYDDILKILRKNKYDIGNKKRYKEELTYILYSLSDNSSYGPL